MKYLRFGSLTLLLTGILAFSATAQEIDDAVRLALPANVVSARAAALGNAFTGVADDYSALYFNPAGLALLRRAEFNAGLMNYNGKTESTFLGSTITDDEGTFSLNSLGIALPFPVDQGSLVMAVGYNKLLDYSNAQAYHGYNAQSSIIPTFFTSDPDYDLAWQIGLEEFDDETQVASFPVSNNVTQDNLTILSGNLGQWSIGGSAEIAKDFMVGAALNIVTGSFLYDRRYNESDERGLHEGDINGFEGVSTDFQSLTYTNRVEQELSGMNLKFGALYNYQNIARFGISIQTPTTITVDESYYQAATAYYANVTDQHSISYVPYSYDITTPWVFSLGASYAPLDFLRVSADIDMRDYSEIELSDAGMSEEDVMGFNYVVRQQLTSAMNYRVGIEFQIPKTALILRGGFGINQSPYDEDVLIRDYEAPAGFNNDRTTISGGIGYIFGDQLMLNAVYMISTYDSFSFVYNDRNTPQFAPAEYVRTEETITNTALMFSFSYFF